MQIIQFAFDDVFGYFEDIILHQAIICIKAYSVIVIRQIWHNLILEEMLLDRQGDGVHSLTPIVILIGLIIVFMDDISNSVLYHFILILVKIVWLRER